MISEHLTTWMGFPVKPLGFEDLDDVPDLSRTICRLHIGWDSEGSFAELVSRFLELEGVDRTPGVIVGAYSGDDSSLESREAVELLVNAHARLAAVRGIFLGDIIGEENEISWINQSDVAPLFTAYPRLEHFAVRGGTGLVLGRLRHEALKSLVVETGGLPRTVLADLAQCHLPALEHLELWLGDEGYGWDGTVEDVAPLVDGTRFPRLRTLGLRNSEIQDEIAAAVAGAPIVNRLEVLDFSLGNLGDEGGAALLRHPGLGRLKKLDLHHHYLSPEMEARVKKAFPAADVSDRHEPDRYGGEEYRSISVAE